LEQPERQTECRGLVLERLSRHGPTPQGDRSNERRRARNGRGRGRARNISGTNRALVELEAELADLHGKEAALVFTSGYVSNHTGIATIARLLPDCLILSDALNHNSMTWTSSR
jgi:7-keto-8-aminopelargonate synthetase-like enzyme